MFSWFTHTHRHTHVCAHAYSSRLKRVAGGKQEKEQPNLIKVTSIKNIPKRKRERDKG